MAVMSEDATDARRRVKDLGREQRGANSRIIFNSSPPQHPIRPLATLVADFLTDLENAGRSPHTITNYRCDLRRLVAFYPGGLAQITTDTLRRFFATLADKAPATRARIQASVNSFLTWCYRHDLIPSNPMLKLQRTRVPEGLPRPVPLTTIRKVLDAIPKNNLRDRLLFTLIAETGLRVGEALGIYYEDLVLTPDDEQIVIRGKGGQRRTVMLYAAPRSLKLLRRYLRQSGIKSGALFRGDPRRGGSASPIHYRTAHHAWRRYCAKAGVKVNIHALRHSFATRLLNEGVSLAVVRKLLGHRRMQTTLRYAEVTDATVKRELRTYHRSPL